MRTLVSLLDPDGDGSDSNWTEYAVVTFEENGVYPDRVEKAVGKTSMVMKDEDEVDAEASTAAIVSTLNDLGCRVLTSGVAEGLTWMGLP